MSILRIQLVLGLLAGLSMGTVSEAATVGLAVAPSFSGQAGSGEVGVTNFVIDNASGGSIAASGFYMDFSGNGDTFGYTGRDGANEFDELIFDEQLPFALTDDSLSDTDPIGIIQSGDFDTLFGVSDTTNGDTGNADLPYSATWTFDISAASGGLSVSVDAAAMGDFEDVDRFDFEYSLDGGTSFTPLFTSAFSDTPEFDIDGEGGFIELTENFPAEQGQIDLSIAGQEEADLPAEIVYQLEGGPIGLKDPMTLEGEFLNNEFQTIAKSIGTTTATEMQIRFTAVTNGGSEGFGFRNLTIEDGGMTVGLAADFNGDGTVDLLDLDILGSGFGGAGTPTTGDANGDGTVDLLDLDILGSEFGMSAGGSTSIPEPTSMVLAAMAIAGLARRRRA